MNRERYIVKRKLSLNMRNQNQVKKKKEGLPWKNSRKQRDGKC